MILPLKYLLQNTIQHILIANEQALCFTWHAHNSQNLAFLFLHSQDYASKTICRPVIIQTRKPREREVKNANVRNEIMWEIVVYPYIPFQIPLFT